MAELGDGKEGEQWKRYLGRRSHYGVSGISSAR